MIRVSRGPGFPSRVMVYTSVVDKRYMRHLITSVLLVLVLTSVSYSAELLHIGKDVQLPLPDHWLPGSDTLALPAQLVHDEYPAEVLVFRSEIAEDAVITDETTLRAAVDLVIEDVIMALPEAKLLTSTGFYDGHRAGFVLEFTSVDSIGGRSLRHRLKGFIYRHPDHHQMLFTVWGKSTVDDYPELEESLVFIQDGFEYRGEYTASVFGSPPRTYWPLFAVALGVIVLFYYMRSRKNKSDPMPLPAESRFWHCSCGRANHEEHEKCRRCGRPRVGNSVG